MIPTLLADPFHLTGQVRADDLTPRQHSTSREFRIACDFRQQAMIKAPILCEFHSHAEYLYAALLEADTEVVSYVPQPFRLRIGPRRYTPDFHVLRHQQPPQIIELKADPSKMDSAIIRALEAFFALELRADFRVIANDEVFSKEVLAQNWLRICRRLHLGRDLETRAFEEDIILTAITHPGSTLWDLLQPENPKGLFQREVALWRSVHKGALKLELTEQALHYDMQVTL